jgi:hypothetical protein
MNKQFLLEFKQLYKTHDDNLIFTNMENSLDLSDP